MLCPLHTQIRYLHYYSSDLSCLFDGIESLLFPMTWQHTLIPALPLARTVFLEAPTPYLIGILYSETGDDTESKIIDYQYVFKTKVLLHIIWSLH